MAAGNDRQGRRRVLEAARRRYGGLSAAGKRRLLDELQELTGYHHKSLLRRLNRPDAVPPSEPGGAADESVKPHHRRRYGPDVVEALLPLLVESLESHDHLSLEPQVRELLLAMSSATIDRLLAPIRKASGGNGWRRPPRAYSAVRRRVPVRTFKGTGETHQPKGW